MTYNFSSNDLNLCDAFSSGESTTGTLEDAMVLAKAYECEITLRDTAAFVCGWVHADGSYTLR